MHRLYLIVLLTCGYFGKVTESCNGPLMHLTVGNTMTPPNYPNDYPLNQRCDWKITKPVDQNTMMVLEMIYIKLFFIKNSDKVCSGSITINDEEIECEDNSKRNYCYFRPNTACENATTFCEARPMPESDFLVTFVANAKFGSSEAPKTFAIKYRSIDCLSMKVTETTASTASEDSSPQPTTTMDSSTITETSASTNSAQTQTQLKDSYSSHRPVSDKTAETTTSSKPGKQFPITAVTVPVGILFLLILGAVVLVLVMRKRSSPKKQNITSQIGEGRAENNFLNTEAEEQITFDNGGYATVTLGNASKRENTIGGATGGLNDNNQSDHAVASEGGAGSAQGAAIYSSVCKVKKTADKGEHTMVENVLYGQTSTSHK